MRQHKFLSAMLQELERTPKEVKKVESHYVVSFSCGTYAEVIAVKIIILVLENEYMKN